jgi:hypothetical protein
MSTVTFAGFSRLNGSLKFRTANDTKRIDQLRKLGDTEVVILALPTVMTKNEAAKFVLTNLSSGEYFVDVAEAELVLTNSIKDENPFAKPQAVKKPRMVKVTGARVKVSKADGDFIVKKIPGTNRVVKYEYEKEPEFSPKESARIRAEFMKQLKAVYEAN